MSKRLSKSRSGRGASVAARAAALHRADHGLVSDPLAVSSYLLARPGSIRPYRLSPLVDTFKSQIQDLRTWHPEGEFRRRRTLSTGVASIRVGENRNRRNQSSGSIPWSLAYRSPHRVLLCIRRNVRRQVLHANRIAGSSVRKFKRRKRNWTSLISCRR